MSTPWSGYEIAGPHTFDLTQRKRLFCGIRELDMRYIHINDSGLERMFAVSANPNIPMHGQSKEKWLSSLEYKCSGGIDPTNGLYRPPITSSRLDFIPGTVHNDAINPLANNAGVKSRAEIEDEVIRELLVLTSYDAAYLIAVAKNVMLHRLSWNGTRIAEYAVREALGIDVEHPYWAACKDLISRNRDTWQARILDAGHKKAKTFLFGTESGKLVIADCKGKCIHEYNEHGEKLIFMVNPELLKAEGYYTVQVAIDVFHEIIQGLDEKELTRNDGRPTVYGGLLMYKAISIIQLEVTYILSLWTDHEKGTYTKKSGSRHARCKETILSYLCRIDDQTTWYKLLSVAEQNAHHPDNHPLAPATTPIKVSILFPFAAGRNFVAIRRGARSDAVRAQSNAVQLPQDFMNEFSYEDE